MKNNNNLVHSMKQHIFIVSCTMGKMPYTVFSTHAETALAEVLRFFNVDPEFKIIEKHVFSQFTKAGELV